MGLPMPFGNPATYPGHSGVDFPQPDGTPIRASGNGVVGLLSWNYRGGFLTWIDYDGGPGVAYAHQWQHYVPEGMRVSEGTIIGYVGSSGRSTGPHLHIEIANQPGDAAVWRYFDRGRVVGVGSAGAASIKEESQQLSHWEEEDMPTIISSVIGQSLAIGPVIVSFGTPEDLKSALDAKVPVLGTSRAMHERILQAAKVATPMPLLVVYGDPGGTVYTFDGDSLDPIYDPDTLNKLLALPGVKPETWSAGEIQRRNAAKK